VDRAVVEAGGAQPLDVDCSIAPGDLVSFSA
jgi:hypothetical protein